MSTDSHARTAGALTPSQKTQMVRRSASVVERSTPDLLKGKVPVTKYLWIKGVGVLPAESEVK